MRADAPIKGKVSIVSGGGSGHLPVFMGYVGEDVLYLYGDYGGDENGVGKVVRRGDEHCRRAWYYESGGQTADGHGRERRRVFLLRHDQTQLSVTALTELHTPETVGMPLVIDNARH